MQSCLARYETSTNKV